ncbi:5'/3'-nucleotidase SurE [Spirochaetia bacterium 38H-sp]|uniref:5'-nucleotidase SurE n=1 Tax=Rarispira pelagica TaxID=3141764 RepID=A0ABU9UBP0_9SPIR
MRVLLTNDDGIDAKGLWALYEVFSSVADVVVIAPDGERSGMSHSFSLLKPVRRKKIRDNVFSCSGSPADCVVIACMDKETRPDVVVSGINKGPNLGTDIIYSGTVAAARQAVLMEIPAFAVSLADYSSDDFSSLAGFFYKVFPSLLDVWIPDMFFNVNAFDIGVDSRLVFTRPSRRIYTDSVKIMDSVDSSKYFLVYGTGVSVSAVDASGYDEHLELDSVVVDRGDVSVSPVFVHPQVHWKASELVNNYREG